MELLGDPPGAKIAQDAIWDASGALHLGAKMGQDGAKLPILAARWAQDGHHRFQNGQLETILGGILPTFRDLGCEKPDSRKLKNKRF